MARLGLSLEALVSLLRTCIDRCRSGEGAAPALPAARNRKEREQRFVLITHYSSSSSSSSSSPPIRFLLLTHLLCRALHSDANTNGKKTNLPVAGPGHFWVVVSTARAATAVAGRRCHSRGEECAVAAGSLYS
jgi:hypothetical protein